MVGRLNLTWDDPESGAGLRVHGHIRKGVTVRETREEDLSFYKKLFDEPRVFSMMGRGQLPPSGEIEDHFETQLTKFSEGIPGGLILIHEGAPVGLIHLCPIEQPGVGEVSRALSPHIHGQGLGKAALGFLVNEWAPVVRSRGLALDSDPHHPTVGKFKCFEGEALALLYTTARPANPASWQAYKYFDFRSVLADDAYQISCKDWEESRHGPLESYIISQHFSGTSSMSEPLHPDVRYALRDEKGASRTVSYVTEYKSLRYHFEKDL